MHIKDTLVEGNNSMSKSYVLEGGPYLQWTDEQIAALWDSVTAEGDEYYTNLYGDRICEEVMRYLAKGCSVVDYGCGKGHLISRLLKSYTAGGVEYAPASVDSVNRTFNAEESFKGCILVEDAENLDQKYDACTMIEVVEHMYDDQLSAALNNVKALLAPGGLVIVTTPNEEDVVGSCLREPVTGKLYHPWQHVRSWDAVGLTAAFVERGFECELTYSTDVKRPRWMVDTGMAFLARKVLGKKTKQPNLVGVFRKC